MAATSKPKNKPAPKKRPPRRGGAAADTTPRKGDKGVPDDMQARYEAGEQGAGSTSIADEMDQSFESGRQQGLKEAPKAAPPESTGTKPASPGRPKLNSSGKLAIGAPLAVETVLISVNSVVNDKRPPLPSQLLVAFAFFGLLGLASGDAAGPAAALGWGVVLATFYSGSGTNGTPPAIGALGAIGDFFGGKYKVKGASPSTSTAPASRVSTTSEAGVTALGG